MPHALFLALGAWAAMWLMASPAALGQQHPYLLFTSQERQAWIDRMGQPHLQDYRDMLIEQADAIVAHGNAWTVQSQRLPAAISALPYAYLLTRDAKYMDLLIGVIGHETNRMKWDAAKHQAEFDLVRAALMALAYDALHDELPDDTKRRMERYMDQGLEMFFPIHKKGGSWGLRNNIGAVFYSYAGLTALARMTDPQPNPRAREVLETCLEGLKGFQDFSIKPYADGAYPEGVLYWNFGVTWYLAFADALQRATGEQHGLLDFPYFQNNHRFLETMLSPDGRTVPFADSQPFIAGAGIAIMLGQKHNQPLLRWAADDMVRRRDPERRLYWDRDIFRVFAAVWRDDTRAPDFPGLPTLSVLESVQWATIRSDSSLQPELQVSAKGNPDRRLSHSQPDQGSFTLYGGGEMLLIDPGYYQPGSERHSLPIIDGMGMERALHAPISAWEQGGLRGITVDMAQAYAKPPRPQRAMRHLVMVNETTVVLLDDIVAAKGASGQVESHFQGAQAMHVSGHQATVHGKTRHLAMSYHGPELTLSVQGPRPFERSWVFRHLSEQGVYSWHTTTATYQASPDRPLVVVMEVIQPEATASKALVRMDRDTIVISVPGASDLVFNRTDDGWQPRRP